MTRRAFLAAAAAAPRPNILFFHADDLGYGDLGCFGSRDIRTPHLDRLAAQGARLTQHYVCAPSCSPSRAGLLTGCYPHRTGVTGVLREEHDHTGMHPGLPTIAEILAGAGYHTALIGKWHLGMPPAYRPSRRGFQYFYGFLNGTVDYYTHRSTGGGWRGRAVTFRNDNPIQETGYLPRLLCDDAVRFLQQKHDRPFFLHYATPLPHLPYQVPDEWMTPYAHLGGTRGRYAAMVAHMDDEAGRLLHTLDQTGLAHNTLVIFCSDNGWVKLQPAHAPIGDNGPYRGGKYELYEGGIHSPCLVRWPGRVQPGSEVKTPVFNLDWFPTLAAAAGAPRPPAPLDGIDITAALRGRPLPTRDLLWTFRDDLVKTPRSYACRRGPWKYLEIGGEAMLFHLDHDPGETHNLAARHPRLLEQLRNRAYTLRQPGD
jgi:arylsulfatase A-like enzyme